MTKIKAILICWSSSEFELLFQIATEVWNVVGCAEHVPMSSQLHDHLIFKWSAWHKFNFTKTSFSLLSGSSKRMSLVKCYTTGVTEGKVLLSKADERSLSGLRSFNETRLWWRGGSLVRRFKREGNVRARRTVLQTSSSSCHSHTTTL